MSNEELKNKLEEAGYPCDKLPGGIGWWSIWCCRIDKKTVRKVLNNKNWTPISGKFENGLLIFHVHRSHRQ